MMDRRARMILWLDGGAGFVAGTAVLLLRDWLTRLHAFPPTLVVFIGVMNLVYASYSGSLATLAAFGRIPALRAIEVLVALNLAWTTICAAMFLTNLRTATAFGLAHVVFEGFFVGALALAEWRYVRPAVREAT